MLFARRRQEYLESLEKKKAALKADQKISKHVETAEEAHAREEAAKQAAGAKQNAKKPKEEKNKGA